MATIDSLKEILNENLDIEPEKVVESALCHTGIPVKEGGLFANA